LKKCMIKKIVTGVLLSAFILTGLIDALLNSKLTYSSIMGMDINRVYFYSFFLLIIGCWLLYNKWIVGIGFLALATFNSYFSEFVIVHNYFASVAIYLGIIIDIITRRNYKWLAPLVIIGLVQGIAFQTPLFSYYVVGGMEFLALCTGTVFIVKMIE